MPIVVNLFLFSADNFAHRTAVRAALAEDSHWQESYFQKITKMMWKQDNVILKAIPDVPLLTEPRKEGGMMFSFVPHECKQIQDS